MGEEVGTTLEPRYVPVPISIYAHRLWADTERQERILGFRPEISVRQGIQRVIAATRDLQERGISLAEHQRYFESLSAKQLQATP